MDSNDPKEFDDPQFFDDPKGISTESMNLDNPKVYGGLVYLCSIMGSDSLFLIGCSFFNLLALAKIVQPGKHGNIYEATAATISTVCTLVIDMMVNNVIGSNKCKNSSRSDAASFHFGGRPTSVNFFNKFTQFASRADRFISVHLLCHNSLYGT